MVSGLSILPIPLSMDNYSYLVRDQQSGTAILIDPADPEPVLVRADEIHTPQKMFLSELLAVEVCYFLLSKSVNVSANVRVAECDADCYPHHTQALGSLRWK